MRVAALGFLTVLGLAAEIPAPEITGRWTGVADTTDEAGTTRHEKQTIEIRTEEGNLTGNRIDKSGKSGLKLDVQQAGSKVNLSVYLDFEGGEPLRWKLELKDGALTGTFSAQHHNPAKWIYDRVGTVTMTKEIAADRDPRLLVPNRGLRRGGRTSSICRYWIFFASAAAAVASGPN